MKPDDTMQELIRETMARKAVLPPVPPNPEPVTSTTVSPETKLPPASRTASPTAPGAGVGGTELPAVPDESKDWVWGYLSPATASELSLDPGYQWLEQTTCEEG